MNQIQQQKWGIIMHFFSHTFLGIGDLNSPLDG